MGGDGTGSLEVMSMSDYHVKLMSPMTSMTHTMKLLVQNFLGATFSLPDQLEGAKAPAPTQSPSPEETVALAWQGDLLRWCNLTPNSLNLLFIISDAFILKHCIIPVFVQI